MRISTDENDPGFLPIAVTRRAKVFCNGVEAHDVLTADEELGEAIRFVRDEDGEFQIAPDWESIVTAKWCGKVEIVIPSD